MLDIPVLTARGSSLALAYENALIALHDGGVRIQTQYDKPDEPKSIDATMNITIDQPWLDPMIHKAFPGGIEDLREYVIELLGEKDHWVKNMDESEDTRWEYTYHQRLADWGTWKLSPGADQTGPLAKNRFGPPGEGINQVEQVVEKLAAQPFTRQAQMITWIPAIDFEVYDPPCLQSLWYRLHDDEEAYYLICNVRFRSNDAWGANFMNMFGITHFNRLRIADPLEGRLAKPVRLGRMNWQADSFHLYGKDQTEFINRFWLRLPTTSFEDRTYHFFDPEIQEIWMEAEEKVYAKIRDYDRNRS